MSRLSVPFRRAFSNASRVKMDTLSNGIRVVSEQIPGHTVALGVFIDAGSRYETIQTNGAAHFLEHMNFKGTPELTRVQLEKSIENMGAHLNAYTSREITTYYINVFKDNTAKAFKIVSDMLQNSLYRQSDIEAEKRVILREMEEVNKNPFELVMDLVHEKAFPNNGLGLTILGPEDNIRAMKKDHIEQYIRTHYTAPRFVIAGIGAIDHQYLVELSEKYFGQLPTLPRTSEPVHFEKPKFQGSEKRVHFPLDKEVHIGLAFEGARWSSDYMTPVMVIQQLLGSFHRDGSQNTGTPFCDELMRRDLCDSAQTTVACYLDTGLIGIFGTTHRNKARDFIWCTLDNLLRLSHSVSDEEVEGAKFQLKLQLMMNLESFSGRCDELGRQMLIFKRPIEAEELFARIDAIQTEDIRATAQKLFNDEDHTMVAVGPIDNIPSYTEIRNRSIASVN